MESAGSAARGLRNEQLSGLVLVAFALVLAWQNRAYPLGSLHDPGPGYMPLMLAVFLGAMGLLVAVLGGKSAPVASIAWAEARRATLILVVCAFGALALEHIGYRLTMIAMLIIFLGIVERRKPLAAAAVAIGFALASHFLFSTLLKVQLPRSAWGF